MRRSIVIVLCAMAAAAWAGAARADSPGGLVAKGNRQYHRKDFGKALDLYERASVKAPESAIVAFNKGDAYYKQGDYEKAREQFRTAASKTKSLPFESKAWYNLGNVAFKDGVRQEDSDLQKALENLQESVKSYGTALEKDPENKLAAENLEIARLKIKDLLDKQKRQQEQGGQQNQQNQQNQQGQKQQQQQQGNENQQDQNKQNQQQQQQGKENEQNKEQQGQEKNRENQQGKEPQGAEKKDQKGQDKNKESASQDQQKKALARDATARDILDQEKEDRKEQQTQNAGYRPAEKDW